MVITSMSKLSSTFCDYCGNIYNNYQYKVFFKHPYTMYVISSILSSECKLWIQVGSLQVKSSKSLLLHKRRNIFQPGIKLMTHNYLKHHSCKFCHKNTVKTTLKATWQRYIKNLPKNSRNSTTQCRITVFIQLWEVTFPKFRLVYPQPCLQNRELSLTSGGQNLLTSNSHHWSTRIFFSVVCCGSGDPTTWRIQQPCHLSTVSAKGL